jgi:hypothetical protein
MKKECTEEEEGSVRCKEEGTREKEDGYVPVRTIKMEGRRNEKGSNWVNTVKMDGRRNEEKRNIDKYC